jgi:hypothetical protein
MSKGFIIRVPATTVTMIYVLNEIMHQKMGLEPYGFEEWTFEKMTEEVTGEDSRVQMRGGSNSDDAFPPLPNRRTGDVNNYEIISIYYGSGECIFRDSGNNENFQMRCTCTTLLNTRTVNTQLMIHFWVQTREEVVRGAFQCFINEYGGKFHIRKNNDEPVTDAPPSHIAFLK